MKMSQNSLFSRRLAEALRDAAASQVVLGSVAGQAAAAMDRLPDGAKEQLRSVLKAIREGEKLPDVPISVHVHRPAVCNRCTDESKEAFPYMLTTIFGDEYAFLCNDCWAELLNASLIASVEDEVWPDEEE
jgi:hypothetical protein